MLEIRISKRHLYFIGELKLQVTVSTVYVTLHVAPHFLISKRDSTVGTNFHMFEKSDRNYKAVNQNKFPNIKIMYVY